MSHVDDGKLNALLDGELEAAEASAVRAHIASCPECTRRLEEAQRFLDEATGLLGALELPAALTAVQPPARRLSKTAKEVAIDIDGKTQQSPAIRPNVPEAPGHGAARAPERGLDFTTLAWAATIVLAVGVGYLANEVRHQQRPVGGETDLARALQQPAPTGTRAAGGGGAAPGGRTDASGQPAGGARDALARARPPSKAEAPAPRHLAQRANQTIRRRAAPTDAVEIAGAAGPSPPSPAPGAPLSLKAPPAAAAREADRPAAQTAATGVSGGLALRTAGATFRRVTLEDAVARLDGNIRLIDGLRAEAVELGPGRLVPGADPERDLVRVVYYDSAGRRFELDQQRVGAPAPDLGDARRAQRVGAGMRPGDTLTTGTPDGRMRVRWVDRTFWLSLTASLPPDSLRYLVGRVR